MPHFLMVNRFSCMAAKVDAPALRKECEEQKQFSGNAVPIASPSSSVIFWDIILDTCVGLSPNSPGPISGAASSMIRRARDRGCCAVGPIGVSTTTGWSLDVSRFFRRVTVTHTLLMICLMSLRR